MTPLGIGGSSLVVAAGPCMLESLELGMEVARAMKAACESRGLGYIFKASFDKANRTSISSERGPGIERGMEQLARIKSEVGVPVLTDIHEPHQADIAARVVDMIQIPAFLCRQTDLLVAASRTGLPINVKKGQFLAPEDMAAVVEKCRASGARDVILCERGASFGYRTLVVDFRSLVTMRALGCPVMFDATHSVQSPGGMGSASGGDRRMALPLARAAAAVGIDALFIEVHPDPSRAKSDGPNTIPLRAVGRFLDEVAAADAVARASGFSDIDWCDQK